LHLAHVVPVFAVVRFTRGELHEEDRELSQPRNSGSLGPTLAKTPGERDKHVVIDGDPVMLGIPFAFIPNQATEREGLERSDHAIVETRRPARPFRAEEFAGFLEITRRVFLPLLPGFELRLVSLEFAIPLRLLLRRPTLDRISPPS